MELPIRNWDEYYSRREFEVPGFIVSVLWEHYEKAIRKHLNTTKSSLVVMELGGANSCFYRRFKNAFPVGEYHILDNNELGLDLFAHKGYLGTSLHNVDLLRSNPASIGTLADIVFSAGLIEHFVPEETRRIVEFHFEVAHPGGLVLMSFPTPTWIYWTFRRFLEKAGRFPPLFERPIQTAEVVPILPHLGTPLECYRIYSTILTQLLTISRKR